jgi:ATP-dependent DNA helicase RecQ
LYAPGGENLVRNLNKLTAATPNEIQQDYSRYQAQQPPTDDRSKVLQSYWLQGTPPQTVATIFADRQAAKERELRALMSYVQTTTCHRAVMLTYFGEAAVTHTEQCCQLAGEPLPLDALGLTATHDEAVAPLMSWEQRLAQLFLPNS